MPSNIDPVQITETRGTFTREGYVRFGSTLQYGCDPEYEMIGIPTGRKTVRCLENGSWSASVPVCMCE